VISLSTAIKIAFTMAGAGIGYYLAVRAPGESLWRGALTGAFSGLVLGLLVSALVAGSRPVHWEEGVRSLSSSAELEQFLTDAGDRKAVVDFYATWCPPCRAMSPNVNEFAKKGNLAAVVDVDKVTDLAERFKISSMPTVVVFQSGKEISRAQGYHSVSALERLVK
jgi:thioredoxin